MPTTTDRTDTLAPRPEPTTPRVLIADDQPDVLEALRLLLKGEGYRIESAGSPAAILDAIDSREFDAVLMDLNYARDTTSGQEGLDLLSQIRGHDPTLPVVVMTAWGSVEVAVEAMRRGARDFLQKPWENARLLTIVRTQVDLARALRRQQRLEAENRALKPDGRPLLIADAPSMKPVLELIARVGPSRYRAAPAAASSPSMPADCRRGSSRASCSVTSRAHSPMPRPTVSAASSSPTAARCSSTRSPTCRSTCSRSCCASSRRATSSASGRRGPATSACGSCPPRTPTSPRRSPRGGFVRICCSGSTRSRLRCHRSAAAARTSRSWRITSSASTRSGTARSSRASSRRPFRRCSTIPGRATSASSIMRSSGRS
ncbi:MAG: hypothetical protein DMF85_07825 [Acidobacteria bacterium]|nr:MAG: hypothetical protein DMF85_07825 [Acidobacteriota bacterium]